MRFNRMSCTPICFCILHHWVSKGSNLVKTKSKVATSPHIWDYGFSLFLKTCAGNGIPRSTSSSKCSWLSERGREREKHIMNDGLIYHHMCQLLSDTETGAWSYFCAGLDMQHNKAYLPWNDLQACPEPWFIFDMLIRFLVLRLYTCQNSTDIKQLQDFTCPCVHKNKLRLCALMWSLNLSLG